MSDEALETRYYHFAELGQWERALEVALQILSLSPDSHDTLHRVGLCYYYLDERENAQHFLKAASKLDPENSKYLYDIARLFFYDYNNLSKAERYIRSAITINPLDENYWIILGEIAVQRENIKEAKLCCEKALSLAPESPEVHEFYIQAHSIESDRKALLPIEQIELFKNLLSLSPEDSNIHFQIGEIYYSTLKSFKKAYAHFKNAISIDPSNKLAKKRLIDSKRRIHPFLRTLRIPLRIARFRYKFYYWIKAHKWSYPITLPLYALYALLAYILYFLYILLIWPVTKCYEILTLAETHKSLDQLSIYKGPTKHLHKAPYSLKLILFTLFCALFWLFWYRAIFQPGVETSIIAITIYLGYTLLKIAGVLYLLYLPFRWLYLKVKQHQTRKLIG